MTSNTSSQKKRTPLQAIRAFCLECDGTSYTVNDCLYPQCPFYDFRFGRLPEGRASDSVAVIKTYCHKECQAGSGSHEVLTCQGDKAVLGPCPVFPFRMGKNPNKSILLSEERRAALVEAGKEYRFRTGPDPPFDPVGSMEEAGAIVQIGSVKNNPNSTAEPCNSAERKI